jgi:hypothetical protein
VLVRNHHVVAKWSVIYMFVDHCISQNRRAYVDDRFLTDMEQPGGAV